MHKRYRAAAALSVCALTVSGALSGCAALGQKSTSKEPIAIGIDAEDPEQRVLGEIYSRVLQQLGRPTSVTAADFSAGDTLRRAVDLGAFAMMDADPSPYGFISAFADPRGATIFALGGQ